MQKMNLILLCDQFWFYDEAFNGDILSLDQTLIYLWMFWDCTDILPSIINWIHVWMWDLDQFLTWDFTEIKLTIQLVCCNIFLGQCWFCYHEIYLATKTQITILYFTRSWPKVGGSYGTNRWENLSQCVSHHSCCCCAGAREAIWQNYSWMLPPPPILIQIQIQIQIDVVLGQERQDYSRKPPTDRAAFVPWPESWVQQWIRRGFV